jgi:hypothetical protein
MLVLALGMQVFRLFPSPVCGIGEQMLLDLLLHLDQDNFWYKEGNLSCGGDPYCQSSFSLKMTLKERSWFMFSWTVARAGKVIIGYERKCTLSLFFHHLKRGMGLEADVNNRNH